MAFHNFVRKDKLQVVTVGCDGLEPKRDEQANTDFSMVINIPNRVMNNIQLKILIQTSRDPFKTRF